MPRLIIIGAGPGGYECAVKAARRGLDVHIIDRAAHLGGTCLNEGCIPTKCLTHTAELIEATREAVSYGFATQSPEPSALLAHAMERKEQVVSRLREGIGALMAQPGITLHDGLARFAPGDPHTVIVGGERLTADYVMIATGSVPKMLPVPGADTPGVWTSDRLLQTREVPRRLCVIGGGVIGLEFASIFATLGSEVTVIEYCKEILPPFDRDIAKRLRTSLKRRGVNCITGAPVTAIHADETRGGELHVSYEYRSSVKEALADRVLMAVGRQPNLASLNLDEAGIAYTPHGITTDDHLMTSVAGVYAVGDINGRCQLAHAATAQSFAALAHILGDDDAPDLGLIPSAVFTSPEAAMVGLTEEQAKTRLGADGVKVHKAFYRANGRALTMNAADDGLVKLITDPMGRLVGAHILGAHAAELIHELTLAMSLGARLDDLRRTVHAHPTLSELIWQAAE